jgi:predicted nucleic acid-binding protein
VSALVVDASVTIAWCIHDERNDYVRAVLQTVGRGMAVVPTLWAVEVGNVLLTSVRRGVLTPVMADRFVEDLLVLPKQVDHADPQLVFGRVLSLARKHKLTNPDACYLELAKRSGLALATLDRELRSAARKERVELFERS